jgi:hypothetical protein
MPHPNIILRQLKAFHSYQESKSIQISDSVNVHRITKMGSTKVILAAFLVLGLILAINCEPGSLKEVLNALFNPTAKPRQSN